MSGTTTNYGWTYPTSTDYVKDGATAIQTLATGIDATSAGANLAGLVLVKTQAVGTGVSSVTVTGAFSSTYDNYRIIYIGGASSTTVDLSLALGGITTGYQMILTYQSWGSASVAGGVETTTPNFRWAGSGNTSSNMLDCEIYNPFNARTKTFASTFFSPAATGIAGTGRGVNTSTASATSFTISAGGTMTGGTIYVYGYRKAI